MTATMLGRTPQFAGLSFPQPKGARTAVLADDDRFTRMALRRVLEGLGYDVYEAEDGHHAWTYLRTHPGVQLLVTDLVMPRMNGLQLILAAHRWDPELAVVAVTGASSGDSRLHSARVRGAASVLKKPFRLEEARDAIRVATR